LRNIRAPEKQTAGIARRTKIGDMDYGIPSVWSAVLPL